MTNGGGHPAGGDKDIKPADQTKPQNPPPKDQVVKR
jgi:hypothetical protein